VFDGRTTSTYEITTSVPKPKLTHEQYAGYAEMNTSKNKDILENFNVAPFFRRALNLEEDAADGKIEEDVSYTLYSAESKRHEWPKFKIMIGAEEISALLDTECELSILTLVIIVLCGFVCFCNVWGCVCVGFVLYGCVRLM
jgi:hypothetical protein